MADEITARSPALNEGVFTKQADRARAAGITETMTLGGTVRACVVLLAVLVGVGVWAWTQVELDPSGTVTSVPGWFWVGLGGGLVIAIVTAFFPRFAPFTAPVYAAAEGLVLGFISKAFEAEFEGIVLQAVLLTLGVFVALLFLYATGRIRATENFRLGVIAATSAIFLVYMVDLVLRFFGHHVPLINDASPLGIAVSVVIVIVAALNLVLDFDFIEKGVDQHAPPYMNWYGAFGLLVTLVWLYLEILRLLAKIQASRR